MDEFWEFCPKNISMGYHFFNKKHMRILCNLNLKTEKVSLSICKLISKIDFVQALQKNLKLNSFEKNGRVLGILPKKYKHGLSFFQ